MTARAKIQIPTVTLRQRARTHTGHPGEGEAAQQTEEVLRRDFQERKSHFWGTHTMRGKLYVVSVPARRIVQKRSIFKNQVITSGGYRDQWKKKAERCKENKRQHW